MTVLVWVVRSCEDGLSVYGICRLAGGCVGCLEVLLLQVSFVRVGFVGYSYLMGFLMGCSIGNDGYRVNETCIATRE